MAASDCEIKGNTWAAERRRDPCSEPALVLPETRARRWLGRRRTMSGILFTGFPGFLATALLPRVLARAPDAEAVCLIQSHNALAARQAVTRMAGDLQARVRLVHGDITHDDLTEGRLDDRFVEIFHLAAAYDLSVPRDLAMRVNVTGTRHVLEFARRCPGLRRFHYVSTCFVSGRYQGLFTELMLEEGQRFNNSYEETKYLAEVLVQRASREGLPVSIYRPAVVVGDSTTGETQKFDGPYVVIQLLLRQPRVALMPVIGNPRCNTLNVVPRDYVVDAIAYLSAHATENAHVYHLADPAPITVDVMLKELARAGGCRLLQMPLPSSVAKFAIDHVPGVYPLLRIPSAAIDYFTHPTTYATDVTQQALAGSGIHCPQFPQYVGALIEFARRHPEIGPAAMF